MKRLEGDGGANSTSVAPQSESHWNELKDRGLITSVPSPSMRQTDYHQINAGDKFKSEVGELEVISITGDIAHLRNKMAQVFLFKVAHLKQVKASKKVQSSWNPSDEIDWDGKIWVINTVNPNGTMSVYPKDDPDPLLITIEQNDPRIVKGSTTSKQETMETR